jgi:HEAT repeat protein
MLDSTSQEQADQVRDAIQQLGTNAVPSLLIWLNYEPPIFRYHLTPICQRLPRIIGLNRYVQRLLIDRQAEARAIQSEQALPILGEAAAPAIPELVRRASAPWSPYSMRRGSALTTLANLGAPATAPLAVQLSSPGGAADKEVIFCVSLIGTNARPLVPLLIKNLNHTNWTAALYSAVALGNLRLEPQLVVPALTNSLNHPRSDVRTESAFALAKFGLTAKDALPALTNALNDPDPQVRTNAARAIEQIVPEPSGQAATQ